MANEVFANDLEIACKAADGKSIACFPDPCFSPPSPSAGWILIPYANTAYAKDTTNASKTVFISGKPIMKKDVSYFKTSTGNEPAAGPKGQFTGVKKGKAYFTSWSMNVKVEGQNVDRHTDGMTHNHGSKSGNAGPWYYADSQVVGSVCDGDKKKAKKKCGKGSSWKKKCQSKEKIDKEKSNKSKKKKLTKKIQSLEKEVEKVLKTVDGLVDKVEKFALKKTAKIAGKAAVKGWLGPIGWAWTAYDVVDGALEVKDMYDDIKKIEAPLKKMNKIMNETMDEIASLDKLIQASINAKQNPCLKARACILHPHNKKDEACCYGQQSHHLLPNTTIQKIRNNKGSNVDSCPDYDGNKAPCACGWGGSYDGEEHQKMHDSYEKGADKAFSKYGKLTVNKAMGKAVTSHIAGNPTSGCNPLCLAAQMKAFYDKACKGSGKGMVIPSTGKTKALVKSAKEAGVTKDDF